MNIYNICKVKNVTASDISIQGQVLSQDLYYEINDFERAWWAFNTDLANEIESGNIVVNDGISDYTPENGFTTEDALELLRLNYPGDSHKIANKKIDSSAIGNNKALFYDQSSDKIIYKGINSSAGIARTIESSLMKDPANPYMKDGNNTFTTMCYKCFPGTNIIGVPTAVYIVAWSAAINKNTDYRLYDSTNAVSLAEKLNITSNIPAIYAMNLVNGFPTTPCVLEMQSRRGLTNNADPVIAAFQIVF